MSFNLDEMARFAAHEQRVLGDYRAMAGPGDERFIQPGGGAGAGIQIVTVRIVSWAGSIFVVRNIAGDGTASGSEGDFEVRAYTVGDQTQRIGEIPISQCFPSVQVGQSLRIAQMRVYIGGPSNPSEANWISGWWTLDCFMQACEPGQ